MALSPTTMLLAKIVHRIPDLQNAVSIISGVTGKAKVLVRDQWSSVLVVSESEQQGQGDGDFLVELRLRKTGCRQYDFEHGGGGCYERRACNYGINDLASFQEFLNQASDQDGFSVFLGLSLFDKSGSGSSNADPTGNNENPQVGQGEIEASSSVLSTVASRYYRTAKRSLEVALNVPPGFNAPPMADEALYRVTATIPSESFFDILKGLRYEYDDGAIKRTQAADAYLLTVPAGNTSTPPVLQITITSTELFFHSSLGVDVSLKKENGGFQLQGAKDDDDQFKLEFPLANLKPLKEATRLPGKGKIAIHVGHPQGCKPLLNCPVGHEGQLGNLFFSGSNL